MASGEVGVDVSVGDGVSTRVAVIVGVAVTTAVWVGVDTSVAVSAGVGVSVDVAVAISVGVSVGVSDGVSVTTGVPSSCAETPMPSGPNKGNTINTAANSHNHRRFTPSIPYRVELFHEHTGGGSYHNELGQSAPVKVARTISIFAAATRHPHGEK